MKPSDHEQTIDDFFEKVTPNEVAEMFAYESFTYQERILHQAGFRCASTNFNDWSYPANPNYFWFDLNDVPNLFTIFFQLNDGNYKVQVDFYTKYGTVTERIHVRRLPIGEAIYKTLKGVEEKLKLMAK